MTATLKVKNGVIRLPSPWQKYWRQAEVFAFGSGDTLTFKRVSKPALSLSEMAREFQKVARQTGLTSKDIDEAIREVRREASKES